jgi:hypothetical protein
MRTRSRTLFATLVMLALASGCHSKEEARLLVTAVDAYRAASNDNKPARADALDKVECTDNEVCAAKAACTKSADATARGLRLQQEVQAAAKSGGGDPTVLEDKWKRASNDLAEGYGLLEQCRAKTQALHDHFGI